MAIPPGILGTYVGFSREEIETERARWIEAQHKIQNLAQDVSIEGKRYTFADLDSIATQIRECNYALRQLSKRRFVRNVLIQHGEPNA